jgi:hypothetical protein
MEDAMGREWRDMMTWLKDLTWRWRRDERLSDARTKTAQHAAVVSPMLARFADEAEPQTAAAHEADLRQAYLRTEAMLRDIRS